MCISLITVWFIAWLIIRRFWFVNYLRFRPLSLSAFFIFFFLSIFFSFCFDYVYTWPIGNISFIHFRHVCTQTCFFLESQILQSADISRVALLAGVSVLPAALPFRDMRASDCAFTVPNRHNVLYDTDTGALVKRWLRRGAHGLPVSVALVLKLMAALFTASKRFNMGRIFRCLWDVSMGSQ